MANDAYCNEEEASAEAMIQEYEYYAYASSEQGFTDWIYQNVIINNGDDLVRALESSATKARYLMDVGLPIETELGE